MGRHKKVNRQRSAKISTLAVLDDIHRVTQAMSVNYEDKIIDLLEGFGKLHNRVSQYQEDMAKLRGNLREREETIEYLKTSLDKTYRELEEEARLRSLAERRLQASEQQLDFIRHILNERGPEDALERARMALVANKDQHRSRTSSGKPVRRSTNFSLSAGSLLDPEDVSHDRSVMEKDLTRLRDRRSMSEPPAARPSVTHNTSKPRKQSLSESRLKSKPNSGKVYRSPNLPHGSPYAHKETLTGPGTVTSQTRVTVTEDQRTHVDTEVHIEQGPSVIPVGERVPVDVHRGVLSSEESDYGRKVASSKPATTSTPSTVDLDSEANNNARKRASDDSQDSYFGLPVKKLITEQAIGDQRNTNRPCTPTDENLLPDVTPVGTPYTGGKPLITSGSASRLTRPHTFWTKTVLKLENCVSCAKRIKFGKTALKCTDCKTVVHHTCKDKAPQPCIPASHHGGTPVSKSGSVNLAELCPANEVPQIPGLVIHCVNEVETRGLSQEGIYRISGTDKQVKDLLDRFLRGRPPYPSLSSVEDIHVVCSCLKLFLRRLSEPLVTYRLWMKFCDLADAVQTIKATDRVGQARELFHQLPRPNRDTFAFLLLHLQRVAQSTKCHMDTDNLAKVLGPTLLGYSCPEPEPLQAIQETRSQQAMMRCLLSMPDELYKSMLQTGEGADSPLISGRVFDTPLLRETASTVSSLSSATPLRRPGAVRKPVFDPLLEPL